MVMQSRFRTLSLGSIHLGCRPEISALGLVPKEVAVDLSCHWWVRYCNRMHPLIECRQLTSPGDVHTRAKMASQFALARRSASFGAQDRLIVCHNYVTIEIPLATPPRLCRELGGAGEHCQMCQ